MKNIFILFLVFTVGCGTQNQNCDKLNPEKAKQLMVEFLYAGNNSDFEKLKHITTPDFKVYLDGDEMNFDELVQFIKDWPEPDKYNFDKIDFEIDTDCNSALVKYYYGPPDQVKESPIVVRYDLHSAYVILVGDELKLKFLHSTTVEQ